MDDEWDLHAVVRACAASFTTNTTAAASSSASASASATDAAAADNPFPSFPSDLPSHDDQNPFDFSVNDYPFQGLQEIYQQLCVDVPPPPAAAAAASMMPFPPPQAQPVQDIMQMKPPVQLNMPIQENVQFNPQNLQVIIPPPVRPVRRRKNQQKMIRQMTQEELSADSWAWRKYGQKPIKGSSYPRNYYRCSTSKGCAARKQVERSPNNPEMFIVSYSGEHTHPRPTHRSSLSGSTRSKLASPPPPRGNRALSQRGGALASSSSSPATGSSFSPATPSMEGEGEGAAAQNVNEDVQMGEEDEGAREEDDENIAMINPSDLMNDDDEMFRAFHQDSDDHSGGGDDFFSSGALSSPPWTPTGSSAATFNGGS